MSALETLAERVARARLAWLAGRAEDDESPGILAAHRSLFDRAALVAARDAWRRTGTAVDRLRLARLVDWAIGDAAAPLDVEARRWERTATVRLPGGGEIPLAQALYDAAHARQREDRVAALDAALRAAHRVLGPLRAERLARAVATLDILGLGDPAAARLALLGMERAEVMTGAEAFLRDTADLYTERLAWLAGRRLGLAPDELTRADLVALFEAVDAPVPADAARLVALAEAPLRAIGLDLAADGRVTVDAEPRPGRRARAACVPVRVPEEIVLLVVADGTPASLEALWHEAGHALHLAAADPTRDPEERRLVDPATAEGIAQLFGAVPMDAPWLHRVLGIGRREAAALARERALRALFLLRRYAARLLVELEALAERDVARLAERWTEALTASTHVRYRPEEALLDADPGLEAAAYLCGAALAEALWGALLERHDEDWYRNPAAGQTLRTLLSAGPAATPDETAALLGASAPAFELLRRRFERGLA